MDVFVVLLRGVNVGVRTLRMADLRAALEGLGLGDVRTYLQSGNAVVAGDERPADLAARLAVRIERDLGMRVGVLVMAASAFGRIVAANPFVRTAGVDEQSLHATLLFTEPGEADFGEATTAAYSRVWEAAFRKLDLPAVAGEEARFVGAPPLTTPVVYLSLPHGYGRSKFTNAYFERSLGAAATTRNWRTMRALSELSQGAEASP